MVMMSPRNADDDSLNDRIRRGQSEVRWESRLWTLFQLGMVALVGFLVMQAVETQRILSQLNTEMRYASSRLDKIETRLERGTRDLYRSSDADREHSLIDKRITTVESRVSAIAEALADIRRRIGGR